MKLRNISPARRLSLRGCFVVVLVASFPTYSLGQSCSAGPDCQRAGQRQEAYVAKMRARLKPNAAEAALLNGHFICCICTRQFLAPSAIVEVEPRHGSTLRYFGQDLISQKLGANGSGMPMQQRSSERLIA